MAERKTHNVKTKRRFNLEEDVYKENLKYIKNRVRKDNKETKRNYKENNKRERNGDR